MLIDRCSLYIGHLCFVFDVPREVHVMAVVLLDAPDHGQVVLVPLLVFEVVLMVIFHREKAGRSLELRK